MPVTMDDMLENDSGNNDEKNSDFEEKSLFVSDNLSRCSSSPLQKLQTVTRILKLSENETPTPEIRATGANFDGVWLGELEYDKNNPKGFALEGGFWFDNQTPKQENSIIEKHPSSADSDHHFQHPATPSLSSLNNDELESELELELEPDDQDQNVSQMKELVYHAAMFRPMNLETETVEKEEKLDEKLRTLQRLVPGGSQMDTVTMLDEAVNYLKFLRGQIETFESLSHEFGSDDWLSNSTSFNFPLNPYFLL